MLTQIITNSLRYIVLLSFWTEDFFSHLYTYMRTEQRKIDTINKTAHVASKIQKKDKTHKQKNAQRLCDDQW